MPSCTCIRWCFMVQQQNGRGCKAMPISVLGLQAKRTIICISIIITLFMVFRSYPNSTEDIYNTHYIISENKNYENVRSCFLLGRFFYL